MINVKIFNTAISQKKASMSTLGAQNELYINLEYVASDICGTRHGNVFVFSQENPDNHHITARIYGYNLNEIEAIPLAQARGLPTASTYDAFNSKIYSSWYNVYPVGDRAGSPHA